MSKERDLTDKEMKDISGGTGGEKVGGSPGDVLTPEPPGGSGGRPTKYQNDPGMGGDDDVGDVGPGGDL